MHLRANVLFIVFVALSSWLRATDISGGNVSGTWTANEGPYVIQGDVRVPENESLIIEAGTEVRFDGQYILRVIGNINVAGAAGDSVSFVSNTGNNLWKGIRLDSLAASSDTARFSHCRITEMSGGQIFIYNTNKVVFEDSRIFGNEGHFAGCFYTAAANTIVRRCQFDNNNTTNQSDGGAMYIWDGEPIIEDCVFKQNTATYSGGAISIWRFDGPVRPLIKNCTFEENHAASGGAVVIHSNCTPIFENNLFTENTASNDGGAIWQGYVLADTVRYRNNTFFGNNCEDKGGAVRIIESLATFEGDHFQNNISQYNFGGGLHIEEECVIRLDSTFFTNNEASSYGALFIEDYSTVKVDRSLFANNIANSLGGAIGINYYNTVTFRSCVIANNSAGNEGGAMRLWQFGTTSFENCTLTNNFASNRASVVSLYWDHDPAFTNCILHGNESGDGTTLKVNDYIWNTCEPEFRNCIVQGGQNGFDMGTSTIGSWENVLEEDPLFLSPSAGAGADYDGWQFWLVQDASPAVDGGTLDNITPTPLDFKGGTRILGEGIDLGATELDDFPYAIDLNGDGQITSDDLLTFMSGYGCTEAPCIGDLDGDGMTNVLDLIEFLTLFQ